MLQITPHHKIFLAIDPADFRKGIDGLVAICQQQLQQEPFSGAFFVFCNRTRQALKILIYDGQGFWLCHKRLSKGRFTWWPQDKQTPPVYTLTAHQLNVLLYNGKPQLVSCAHNFRPFI